MSWSGASAEDSARLLAGIATPDVPDEFWGGIYNIGGGEGWRLTNWQLQTAISAALGVAADVQSWHERKWFATGYFHGQWYTDSDRLLELVPFREDTFEEALRRAVAALPSGVRNAGRVPGWIGKHLIMKPLARQPRGIMHAVARSRPPIPGHRAGPGGEAGGLRRTAAGPRARPRPDRGVRHRYRDGRRAHHEDRTSVGDRPEGGLCPLLGGEGALL